MAVKAGGSTSDSAFVDLYDLLDVWPDADGPALRRRISELYLAARDNLEHQNHRKRFYYRELFEVQLPHARLILLDPQKRAEYDRQLQEYWKHKGKPSTPTNPGDISRPKLEGLPGAVSEAAADDFSDFADIDEDALPPLQLHQPVIDRATIERRRDNKRRELIKHELVATGTRWALLGGLGALLLGGVLVFVFYLALQPGSPLFFVISAALLIGAVGVVARQTMRWAKRRIIGVLSQMPYDELLRHCGAA